MPHCVKYAGHLYVVDLALDPPDGWAELSDGARLELVPGDDGHASAVVRREADGPIGWRVRPPEGERDAWVNVHLTGDSLVCHAWSCWLVRVDPRTGTVIERRFTE